MNLIDCTVTKVLGEPYIIYGKWWVRVEFDSYGVPGKTEIMLPDNKSAMAVAPGYKFKS